MYGTTVPFVMIRAPEEVKNKTKQANFQPDQINSHATMK